MRGFKHIMRTAGWLAVGLWSASISLGAGKPVFVLSREIADKKVSAEIARQAKNVGEAALSDRVQQILSDAGYLAPILTADSGAIMVDPGPLYTLTSVHTVTVHADGSITEETGESYRGATADRTNVERLKKDIITSYQQQGYHFASLTVDSAALSDSALTLHLRVISGPQVMIAQVRFRGLTRTDPRFVRHLTGLETERPLLQADIEQAMRALERSEFLTLDSIPEVIPNEEYTAADILFHVREMKSQVLELGGGYLPRQGNQAGEFVGRFDFHSVNLFGSGRKARILLERKDRASSRLLFGFSQPFFIPEYLETSVRLEQVDYDSSYQSFSVEGTATLTSGGGGNFTGGISWLRISPAARSHPPSRTLSGLLRYGQKQFDVADNPARGHTVEINVAYLHRTSRVDSIGFDETDDETMFGIAGGVFIPVAGPWVFHLNVRSDVRLTGRDIIDYAEMFKLGGYGSLRGYRQEQFAGRRIVLVQSEWRWRPAPNLAIYLFGDWGYLYDKKEISPGRIAGYEIHHFGKGFGLFIGNGASKVSVELGWGEGDHLDQAKIHLGLVTLF